MTSEGWTRCVVALGTNMGEREDIAFHALADIRAIEGFAVVADSSLHETVALTKEGFDPLAPPYVNQVILMDSAWSPEKTLSKLFEVEHRHGRVRGAERYAPRTLDLDLIKYGDLVLVSENLTLPHPRAHERRFVLAPWLEIEEGAELPGFGRVSTLLERIPEDT